MEVVYKQGEDVLPSSSADSETSTETDSNSNDDADSDQTDDEEDLKEDLQKHIPEFRRSELNLTSQLNITNDDEAAALCDFMDILKDLDEVLDKSLLACLNNNIKNLDSDEEDLICKLKDNNNETFNNVEENDIATRMDIEDDNDQVVTNAAQTQNTLKEIENITEIPLLAALGRSKSFSEPSTSRQATLERVTTNENSRESMRRLDPIVLPIAQVEPLTLPVILFLDHVNMGPISVGTPLQVTTANLSTDNGSGPLIVGRRALLMNRTLSLPSPGESDVTTGEWTGRNTARSTARSTSASSSSSESLSGIAAVNQTTPSSNEERTEESVEPPFGVWPHRMSAMLACLSCTVGIFNISRFAMFSVHFGASFIIQFAILSFVLGIPLFTLHLCLGQVLESGPVDMWRISPIFQGVGVSLLITQAVIGVYSIIGLSWIFVYFRDSFITSVDKYKWALPHGFSFEDPSFRNSSFAIQDTLPQYFHSEVLQRNVGTNQSIFGTIKFQVAFNLAVVWMIVFVSLSKGLRSYGKAIYILIFLPICGILVLCVKLLTLIPYDSVVNIFSETQWGEFFVNSNSWGAAAQESFLTWGLLGACVMQLTSHKNANNKSNKILQKESACIVSFTFAVLLLASFLANTCVQILKNYGLVYIPGSFETPKSSQFLYPISQPIPGGVVATPARYLGHYGSLVGVTIIKSGNIANVFSGWQPLQLATQIVPATLAVLPANMLSPAWAVIFYFILIMFGIAQQLAIWHCVIAGIMAINSEALKIWETTITFLSCVCGLAIGLLLSTDAGVRIVHFIDYVWIGTWWQCAIQVALAIGVFVVRGRPYSPDVLASALIATKSKMAVVWSALLSFVWTVVLPVLLCVLCVMDFRVGMQKQLYTWRKTAGYWPVWARQAGVFMQQFALLIVPVTAFIQTWRYMSKGPNDILERIQNLYRPRMTAGGESPPAPRPPASAAPAVTPRVDPPPKYTPPPSYSTATGARLMNSLRRSYRTLRRITTTRSQLDETSQPMTLSESVDQNPIVESHQPPDYAGVCPTPSISITNEVETRPQTSTSTNSMSLTRDYLRRSFIRKSDSVKSIRSSLRRSFRYGGALSTSHEHLVRDAEPISNTVAMTAMLDSEGTSHTHPSVI